MPINLAVVFFVLPVADFGTEDYPLKSLGKPNPLCSDPVIK
jgi:hypothetical protein